MSCNSSHIQKTPLSNVFFIHNPHGTKKPSTLGSCDDIEGCSPCVYFKPWVNFGVNCRTRAALEEQRDYPGWQERVQ